VNEEKGRGSVGFRVLLGVGGVIAVGAVTALLSLLAQSTVILAGIAGIGATQWLVLVPLVFWLRKRGETQTVQGILLTGGMVFLLNATCWGLVMGRGRFR
jgi:hypothetical protein